MPAQTSLPTYFRLENLWLLMIFSIPLSVRWDGTGVSLSIVSEILLVILGVLFVLDAILHPEEYIFLLKHPLSWIIAAWLGWNFISSITSSMPLVSWKRSILFALSAWVLYAGTAKVFKQALYRERWFQAYIAGFVPVMIFTLLVHGSMGFSRHVAQECSQPFYSDHTIYGAALAFFFPWAYLRLRFFKNLEGRLSVKIAIFSLLTFATYAAASRGSWIGVLAALGLGILLELKVSFRVLIATATSLVLLISLNSDTLWSIMQSTKAVSNGASIGDHLTSVFNVETDVSNKERLNRWVSAIRMHEERPWLGFGPGTYTFEYGSRQEWHRLTRISTRTGNLGHAHSDFFLYLSETGYPGVFLWYLLQFAVLYYGMRAWYAQKIKLTE